MRIARPGAPGPRVLSDALVCLPRDTALRKNLSRAGLAAETEGVYLVVGDLPVVGGKPASGV